MSFRNAKSAQVSILYEVSSGLIQEVGKELLVPKK